MSQMVSLEQEPELPIWMIKWLDRGLVSPSDLSNFWGWCETQWKFNRSGNEGVWVDKSRSILGSNIHLMIKYYFQRVEETPSPSRIRRVAKDTFTEFFDKGLSRLERSAKRCWRNFMDFEVNRRKTWDVYMPTLVEEKLYGSGYVCIVDFHQDEAETTVDWKSGRFDQLKETNLFQSKINQIVLNDNNYESNRFLFVALYSGRQFETPYVTRGWVDEQRKKMIQKCKDMKFTKNTGSHCNMCPHYLECQFEEDCLWEPSFLIM